MTTLANTAKPPELTPDASSEGTSEWITMKGAAELIGVPYNDIVIAVHNLHMLESRKEGVSRFVLRAEVLQKTPELKNLPVKRRPNRRIRGRKTNSYR